MVLVCLCLCINDGRRCIEQFVTCPVLGLALALALGLEIAWDEMGWLYVLGLFCRVGLADCLTDRTD